MTVVRRLSIACGIALLAGAGPAHAQVSPLIIDPVLTPELTAPHFFEGLYAGVIVGPISNRMENFFEGADLRGQAGIAVGYNTMIAPGILAGGEIQSSAIADSDGLDFDIWALGRLGAIADHDFLVYGIGGVGYFVTAPAFAIGGGFEYAVTREASLRLEAVGFGQIGDVPNGNDSDAISGIRITAGGIYHFGHETYASPVSDRFAPRDPIDFAGPYAGLYAGGAINPEFDIFEVDEYGYHQSRFLFGAAGGYNFELTPNIFVGAEAQGGINFNTSGNVHVDALGLARVGVAPFDRVLAYGAAGAGTLAGKEVYALGGGIEFGVWDQATARAEYLAIGRFGEEISTGKATAGVIWHFD